MSSTTVILPKPHPKQAEFLRGRKRFNALKCGRRFGKTEICQVLIAEIIAKGGITGYWSPTYKDLSEVWKHTKHIFHDTIVRKDEQLHELQLIGGGKVDFWSMDDPDSGRGRKYHRAIMDECEKAGKFQEAWEQSIRATLADYRGDAYFLSTPQFGDTYFKTLCKNQDKYDNWKTFVYTTYDNPYISNDEIEEMAIDMHPSVFDCEILAKDVDGKTLNPFAFQFRPEFHVSEKAVFQPSKPIIISLDFNLQPFAVTFSHFWRDSQGVHDHTFDEAEIEKGSIPDMVDLIKMRYGKYLFACEITGDAMGRRGELSQRDNASLYIQLCRGLGIDERHLKVPKANPTHVNSKSDVNTVLFKSTKPGFEFLINPSCKGVIRDLRSVQWDNLKGEIKKRKREDVTQRADLLDSGIRYKVHTYWQKYIR